MIRTLLIASLVILLLTLTAWLFGVDPLAVGHWSGQANETIKPWRVPLMLVRWSFWGLLWWRWEPLGKRLFKGGTDSATEQRAQWNHLRSRLLGGIAGVEILIVLIMSSGE